MTITIFFLVLIASNANAGSEGSFEFFKANVVPILETRCANGCHGLEADAFDAVVHQPGYEDAFYFPVDRDGRLSGKALTIAFDRARSDRLIDRAEDAVFSDLARIPQAVEFGGLPHHGLTIFSSPADPGYVTLLEWIGRESAERPLPKPHVPEEVQFFRDKVLGVMARNSCFLSSCHSPQAFNDLKLTPPLPNRPLLGAFSARMVAANRLAMLGKFTRLANLGGDLKQSRIILKNLPIAEGGIHQRSGNDQFFESFRDKDVETLLAWLGLERKALSARLTFGGKQGGASLGQIKGLAFIRGPRHIPRTFFSFDAFWPGSDIFLLPLAQGETLETAQGKPVNLTAALHPDGPAEIQAFDVRYDGRALVFSMRLGTEQGFRLYEMTLDDGLRVGNVRQISFSDSRIKDVLVHHIDPLYAPASDDTAGIALDRTSILYASNESGSFKASDAWGILGEADSGDSTDPAILIDVQRPESPGTFTGLRLAVVAGPDTGAWRTITDHQANGGPGHGSRLLLNRPLPHVPGLDTIYVIEKRVAANLPAFDIWRLSGGNAHRFSFLNGQERRPTMRTDGEALFTTVRNSGYQDGKPVFNGAIFRTRTGGFDFHPHGGERSRYSIYADSREMASGIEIRLATDPRNFWQGGSLVINDHGLGLNIEPDNPVDNVPVSVDDLANNRFDSVAAPRYIPVQTPLFSEIGEAGITHTGVSPGGGFRDPYPLPDGSALAAFAAGPLDHLDPNADPNWDIVLLRPRGSWQSDLGPESGLEAGKIDRIPISAASSDMADYAPRPIMVRLKEKTLTDQKFTAAALDKVKEVDGVLRAPDGTPAEIEIYDYNLIQSFLTNFVPIGPRDFQTESGNPSGRVTPEDFRFRYVRIILDVPSSRDDVAPIGDIDPFATPMSKGIHTRAVAIEVPLNPDGSLYVQAPPNTPFSVQGLNKDHMALNTMIRRFYTQPGERFTMGVPPSVFPMMCSGCHGALTGKPQDGVGPVDIVTAASRVMANWDMMRKAKRTPAGKNLQPGDIIAIDYVRDIQPILDQRCTSCHDDKAPGGLSLLGTPTRNFTRSYEELLTLRDPASGNFADKRYVNEREGLAIESPLITKLTGKRLDRRAQTSVTLARPHPENAALTPTELLTLIRWIDLGATFVGGK